MRINVDLTAVLVIAAGGWLWWQWRQGAFTSLGPPSDELMQYRGQQVRPALWENWNWTLGGGIEPYSAQEAAEIQRVADTLNNDVGYTPGGFL
ncbi:hypothetical protein QLQ85_08820 [Halomonas sp. M4R5S39]|uniref:hypothetical protein n=1 Tax=Halomonas kalidii TaxID=3043293 RepID=UPI0024A8F73B|nr:hypothetical protein [Halomonas kalidii]MDI5984892.1 hypothetical protein [Halomonas kalidii]